MVAPRGRGVKMRWRACFSPASVPAGPWARRARSCASATAAAAAFGSPCQAVMHWPLPAGLTPGDYLLVLSAEDAGGAMQEFGQRRLVAIMP
jgi:hypothetical protein